jgi:hypothetical protein
MMMFMLAGARVDRLLEPTCPPDAPQHHHALEMLRAHMLALEMLRAHMLALHPEMCGRKTIVGCEPTTTLFRLAFGLVPKDGAEEAERLSQEAAKKAASAASKAAAEAATQERSCADAPAGRQGQDSHHK